MFKIAFLAYPRNNSEEAIEYNPKFSEGFLDFLRINFANFLQFNPLMDGLRTFEIYYKKALVALLTHMQNWEAWDTWDHPSQQSFFFEFYYETNT